MGDLDRGDDDGDPMGEYLSSRTPELSIVEGVLFGRRLRFLYESGVEDVEDEDVVDDDGEVVATEKGEV